jgi:hypothetical protein
MKRIPANVELWKQIRRGDLMLFLTQRGKIVASGLVESTEIGQIRGYANYPLIIHFQNEMSTGVDIDVLSDHQLAQFSGGITSVAGDKARVLEDEIERQRLEQPMWVEPNPYLLRARHFQSNPQQVFVVIAWDLRTTVFPELKETLDKHGYAAVYAGERNGQVVFEDIWKMMNESGVVLVDFTGKRPNVYLEYGMALVLGKPIIAITQNKDDMPSDTPNLKYILYQSALGDRTLREKVPRAIEHTLADFRRSSP